MAGTEPDRSGVLSQEIKPFRCDAVRIPANPRRRVLETRILTPRRHRGASSCPQRFSKPDAGAPLLTSFNLLHPITGSETGGGSRAGASSHKPQCRRIFSITSP